MIDVSTGAIGRVPSAGGKNINPQWSPDGRALYFISDRTGIPNLYRVALAGGDIQQLTRVGTGLSGITNSSPALSVSAQTGVASFSIYEGGKYDIYTLDVTRGAGGERLRPASSADARDASEREWGPAAILPPLDRRTSQVADMLADPLFGLPPVQAVETYEIADYKPALQLEAVGQPMVAVGASRFGAAVGGGVSFYFSDMLGDHTLITALQLQSLTSNFSLKDTSAEVAYFNQAHRWNWGLIGGQVPYLSGGFQSGVTTQNGQVVGVDQTLIFRQTERSVSVIAAYPFSRAKRVEFQTGVTQISFDQIIETTLFDLNSGGLISDSTSTTSLAQPLTLGTTSAAFVHDTANFGATSPVQGQRYRFEAAPTFGSIAYTGLLADYRRYLMPVPFYTLAARMMHYGRYGSGSEDERLYPLFLGYPTLVHGYDYNSFTQADCVPNGGSQCPAFDRLIGSRMLVGNLEFRFPLLRPFGVSQNMYSPVPVEVALFADGGVTWNNRSQTSPAGVLGSPTEPRRFRLTDGVSSAGVALRVNLFGYAVGELAFARPFQRPGRGWIFQFNLAPGW